MTEKCDVFICHASADKKAFVRPLAEALCRLSVTVWYDEFSLHLGDSVSQQIDKGIAAAKFGVVVISSVRRKTRKSLILQGVTADFKWRRSSRCRILCG